MLAIRGSPRNHVAKPDQTSKGGIVIGLGTFRLIAVGALALVVSMPMAPADAATRLFRDAAGDVTAGTDIQRVRVHNAARVLVTVTFRDIRGNRGGGFSVFFDTVKSRLGPEFGASAGLARGTDFSIVRMRHWHATSDPISCPLELTNNYLEDTSTFTVARSCLNNPGRVRVSVTSTNNRQVTDWAPAFHTFYAGVPRF
jgi:hypothetical protein